MMVICIKQHLSNIWSWIYEKVQQHWGLVEKKRIAYKKDVYTKWDLVIYFSIFPYLFWNTTLSAFIPSAPSSHRPH